MAGRSQLTAAAIAAFLPTPQPDDEQKKLIESHAKQLDDEVEPRLPANENGNRPSEQ